MHGVRRPGDNQDAAGAIPANPSALLAAMNREAASATVAVGQDAGRSSSQQPRLVMRNVVRTFPGVRAVDDVSFEVRRGEVHALIGETGAGKSAVMHSIAGVDTTDGGAIG